MVSVLTITYQRYYLLEEAIQSFLLQKDMDLFQLVVINDCPDVKYVFNHPNVKIVNVDKRFSSIGKKLEWGYKQCDYSYIYRLDDDDLLAPDALSIVKKAIETHPNHEIYRSERHYYFVHNVYEGYGGAINNGNVYSKEYLNRITFPELSGDEDLYITFKNNADIFTIPQTTMIYRWGMSTYHISGMGIQSNSVILARTDLAVKKESGTITLSPHFKADYYSQLPK